MNVIVTQSFYGFHCMIRTCLTLVGMEAFIAGRKVKSAHINVYKYSWFSILYTLGSSFQKHQIV